MFAQPPKTTESEKVIDDMIALLEAIKHFKRNIEYAKISSISLEKILNDVFPRRESNLKKRREHDIEIYQMCIRRLVQRYNKLNKEFQL